MYLSQPQLDYYSYQKRLHVGICLWLQNLYGLLRRSDLPTKVYCYILHFMFMSGHIFVKQIKIVNNLHVYA